MSWCGEAGHTMIDALMIWSGSLCTKLVKLRSLWTT